MNALKIITENEMREWLLECFTEEYDQEQINSLNYEGLKKAINRYFDGGFESFLDCMLSLSKHKTQGIRK